MKRTGLILALYLLAASCSKPAEPATAPETGRITFSCVLEPDSKAAISDQGKVTWEPGDEILIHGKWAGGKYSSTVTLEASGISADGRTATFTVDEYTTGDAYHSDGLSDVYAIYPASAAAVDNGKTNWRSVNKFNESNLPLMIGYNTSRGGTTIVFRNVCGVISFKVSGDFDSYEFSGNDNETVAYEGLQSRLYLRESAEYSNWIYAGTPLTKVSGSMTADGSTVNYVCIPAGADFSKGFSFRFKKNGTLVKTAKSNTAVNVARSHLLNLGDISSHLEDPSESDIPGNHCRPEFMGEMPVVTAYLTEYTSASLLDANYVTHINYAHGRFANPSTGDGGITIASPDLLKKVVALKQKNPSLKVLLMIGGWGAKADGFSMMARDPGKRTLFCRSCKEHIDTYGLDGIDIDWEYPTQSTSAGNGASPDDAANFNLVLKELRETIGDTKIISYASSSSARYVEWSGAMEYLDLVNVMTYDMGSPPYHNATLYHSSITRNLSAEESVNEHLRKGVPLERIVLGVPFYGHGISPYKEDVKYNEMEAIFANTSGLYTGKNIRVWDDTAKVPYLVDANGTMLLGYDDAESVAWKGRFAKEKGLAGAMFWEYRHDDSSGTLRKALWGALRD